MSDDSRFIASEEYLLDDAHPEEVMVIDFLRRLKIDPKNIEQYSLSFVPTQDNNDEFQFVVVESLRNPDIELSETEFSDVSINLSLDYNEQAASLGEVFWEQKTTWVEKHKIIIFNIEFI